MWGNDRGVGRMVKMKMGLCKGDGKMGSLVESVEVVSRG